MSGIKHHFSPHLTSLISPGKRLYSSISNRCLSLPSYDDIGDCSFICKSRGAFFWFDERVLYLSRPDSLPIRVCRSSFVVLPYPLLPPELLVALYDFPPFMKDIRGYNNMFSMTSFEGKVDDDINRTDGPYVFKISDQVCHWIGAFGVVHEKGSKVLAVVYG